MSHSPVIIVGFGSAGYAALMSLRTVDPAMPVTVVDPKGHDLLHPCGLPYALDRTVDSASLVQDINLPRMRVSRVSGSLAGIDPASSTIVVNGPDGTVDLAYHRLLIATGARPLLPSIAGARELLGAGLHHLSTLADCGAIGALVSPGRKAVVVGGGAIGIETAWALSNAGLQLVLVEREDQLLPGVLDPDAASLVAVYLADAGIAVLTGTAVTSIEGSGHVSSVVAGDRNLEAGLCVLAAGFRPDTTIPRDAGLAVSDRGIGVDQSLRSADAMIYAAGDCIDPWSVIDDKPVAVRLATSAYLQGIIAGANLAGEERRYRGTAGTFVTRIGSLEVAGTGFTTALARARGFTPVAGKLRAHLRPSYYPDNAELLMKVIIDGPTGRILGAQAVGSEGAAARINVVSLAIERGLTADELGRVELAYCPSVSECYDPLLKALDFARRRR